VSDESLPVLGTDTFCCTIQQGTKREERAKRVERLGGGGRRMRERDLISLVSLMRALITLRRAPHL
jgi:hypothetical protein